MRSLILLIFAINKLVFFSQEPVSNSNLKGTWKKVDFNLDDGSETLSGITWNFTNTICMKTETVEGVNYSSDYSYSIVDKTCKDELAENGRKYLVLKSIRDSELEYCYLIANVGKLEESDDSIYLTLYPSGGVSSIVFIKVCPEDSDNDGINDCEDDYTTFNLDFFANYTSQNTDTTVSINGYIHRITTGSVKENSFFDFNGTTIKRYAYNDGFVVYFSPKDLHAMEITGSAYELSNGVKVGDDIAVLASNYPTEYTSRNQTRKEVTVTVPISGAPNGTMVFHYDINNRITKIAIELRAYQ